MSAKDNVAAFDLDQVEIELKKYGESTVQFDRPIGETLSIVQTNGSWDGKDWPQTPRADYLARVNAMCREWGPKLTVRFYGHYGDVFDGRSVHQFPDAHSLSVNCIHEAENVDAIGELPHLSRLSVGIYELKDKALLSKLPLERLTHLTLTATETKALDLAPLADAKALQKLYLEGHHKNIAALANLNGLQEFTFNAKKGLDLSFINGMSDLRALKFNLGGTESIENIALDRLQDIAFTKVRGLSELGDMQRFPALRRLLAQDLQQFARIKFGAANQKLEHLHFFNCGKLTRIEGLAQCPQLLSLRWLFTDIDPASLDLPKSLTHLHMLSGKRSDEAREKEAIEAMGYIAGDHRNASFSYK
ncbi:MAG: hypothetical protein AAGL68_08405 [Pseudomonadota bacterium]